MEPIGGSGDIVDGGKLERIDNAKKFTENEMINFHIKFA
jgi:hypothetical protein